MNLTEELKYSLSTHLTKDRLSEMNFSDSRKPAENTLSKE
jgi:hypothetical protein